MNKTYAQWVDSHMKAGTPMVKYLCPRCGGEIMTLKPVAGEIWDSVATCPHCYAAHSRTVREDNITAIAPRDVPVKAETLPDILAEMRAYVPSADAYGGRHIIPGWAERIGRLASVPAGWVMVPLFLTDAQAEAIAGVANCCGGIALDIYNAAINAAPDAPATFSTRSVNAMHAELVYLVEQAKQELDCNDSMRARRTLIRALETAGKLL